MTIEKGGLWGEPWSPDRLGIEVVEVADDEDLARSLADAIAEPAPESDSEPQSDSEFSSEFEAELGSERTVFAPRSGDLLRTLGLDESRSPDQWHQYPIDLGLAWLSSSDQPIEIEHDVEADAGLVVAPFVAHLTVRNRRFNGFGPGLSVAVMNAAWLGPLRLGPRAHPNDGVVDVLEGTVGLLQRREANRRATTGSHVPHPALTTKRAAEWSRTWPRPVRIWLDGRPVGRYRSVAVEVIPDAGEVVA